MIKYQYRGNQEGPVLLCDVCGHRINDASLAAAVHKTLEAPDDVTERTALVADVLYVHKGECLDQAELFPDVEVGWEELRHHLLNLLFNMKFTPEEIANAQEETDVLY